MFKLVVLFSVVALAAAKPSLLAPVTYSATVVPGSSSVSEYSTSVVHGGHAAVVAPTVYSAGYYTPAVAALSQPPHSPAVILDAVHGVPLDTPEVVAAKVAHFQAKALSGVHHLGKRSVGAISYSSVVAPRFAYTAPLVSTYNTPLVSPVVSPFAYSAVVPKALSVHPW